MHLPTRRRGNDNPSLLDLLFTDEAMRISDISRHAPLGKSDHDIITFKFHSYMNFSKSKERFIYDRADFRAMRNQLIETNWSEKYLLSGQNKTVEESWRTIKSKLIDLRNQFVPKTKASNIPTWRDKGCVPISKSLQEAIQNKKTSHRHWMSSKTSSDAEDTRKAYTKARNKVKTFIDAESKKKLREGYCTEVQKQS